MYNEYSISNVLRLSRINAIRNNSKLPHREGNNMQYLFEILRRLFS